MNSHCENEDRESNCEECRLEEEEKIPAIIYLANEIYKLFAETEEKEVWTIFKESIYFWARFPLLENKSMEEREIIIKAVEGEIGKNYQSFTNYRCRYSEKEYEVNLDYALRKFD